MEKALIKQIRIIKDGELVGIEGRETKEIKIKQEIILKTDLESKKIVRVGKYVLVWHPKIKSKNFPTGVMMIFTKDSYKKAQDWGSKKNKNKK